MEPAKVAVSRISTLHSPDMNPVQRSTAHEAGEASPATSQVGPRESSLQPLAASVADEVFPEGVLAASKDTAHGPSDDVTGNLLVPTSESDNSDRRLSGSTSRSVTILSSLDTDAQLDPHLMPTEHQSWLWADSDHPSQGFRHSIFGDTAGEPPGPASFPGGHLMDTGAEVESPMDDVEDADLALFPPRRQSATQLSDLPNEILLQILGYLEVCDLLATSRTSHHLRHLSLAPILQHVRLRRTRAILPPMLTSPTRPLLADLIARHIFLTRTTVISRQLARSLVSIRLARRLASRPSAETLVERCVLPPECVPGKGVDGGGLVAPALVAKKRAVERERVKDGLRRWVGSVWKGEVRTREEGVRRWEEKVGVGRVWRLRRFWERVSQGEGQAAER